MKKKVLVAFSGGLDTSFCVKYLKEEKEREKKAEKESTAQFKTTAADES